MTDIGIEYMAKREQASLRSAGDELLARVDSLPPGGEEAPPQKPQESEGGFGAVMKDIGRGLTEAPKQIVGGINEAVVNAVKMADPLVEWLEKNVAELPRYEIPTVDPAETVTGGVVREGARFLTGFVPAFRALKGAGIGVAASSVGAGALSEAATANPTSEGFSNLIQSVPALKNPVTEYLATNPDDPEALNRLRKGIEGAGFGMLTEGVLHGIRAVAKAKGTVKPLDALEEARALYGSVKDSDFAVLGDPSKPLVTFQKASKATKAAEDVQPGQLLGERDGEQVFVNFSRIAEPDDVKKLLGKAADIFSKDIDKARRGVQSNEETLKLADELGMSVGDVLNRRKGQPFNAEEAVAARKLWNASGEKLLEVAKKAASPDASKVDQFNFRRMMAVHYAIQSEVIGARTETARALQSWSIPVGGGVEKARAIAQLMDSTGGPAVSQEMAKRLAVLADSGAPAAAVRGFVRKGWGATSMDMVKESFVNGLLWSPSTHAVNVTSNIAFQVLQTMERGVASQVSQFLGREGVHEGEALAMSYGLVTGLKDAFRMGAKAIATGERTQAGGKIDLAPEAAISSRAVAREMGRADAEAFARTGLGQAIDLYGTATRIPGRLLGGEDEFFKSIAYRAELHAQSVRMAASEGYKGPDLYKRMAEIANDPPENIRLAAADAALYATFQNQPGQFAQALMKARQAGEPFNPTFLFLPFIRTPANLFNRAVERSPLAPLMSSVREDLAAGGARADLASARMILGSGMMAVAADLAYSGIISGAGPDDPGEREALQRQGWQPFAVKIGDKWVQYQRMDPTGMTLGVAATLAETFKRFDIEPEETDEWQEIAGAAVAAVGRSVVNKTYLENFSRVIEAIGSADQSPRKVAQVLNQTAASVVPFTSLSGTVERAVDPTVREAENPLEAIQARIVGLSKNLKPARDLWGQAKKPDAVYGTAFDISSPMAVRQIKDSPIDAEMTRLNLNVQRIPGKADFNGVAMNLRDFPEVKDAYERLAGNELKNPAWGLGAKDFLDKVVSGDHPLSAIYKSLPDTKEGKGAFIQDTVSKYRQAARNRILGDPEFSEFRAEWDQRRLETMQRRMPQ